jgi:hypothetical protein
MAILNKRNAILGWSIWQVTKRVAKQKAKAAVPGGDESKRRSKGAIASALAAAGGALWLWRRRRADTD